MNERYPTIRVENLSLDELLDERRKLLDRKFANDSWDRMDEARLTWIRWQLDRLEMSGRFTVGQQTEK